jgi:hypothetical protein
VLFTGCASIVSDASYPVAISSTPDNAEFVITNRAGTRVHSGVTPATITLKASSGYFKGESYTIVFNKEGHPGKSFVLKSGVDGWYFGNILFGGLIGMLIVGPATGAMYKLPNAVALTLDEATADSSTSSLTIASIDSLSNTQKAQLVKLN